MLAQGQGCGSVLPILTASGDRVKRVDVAAGRIDPQADVDPTRGAYGVDSSSLERDDHDADHRRRCGMAPFTPKIL